MAQRKHQIELHDLTQEILTGARPIRRIIAHVTTGGGKSDLPPILAVGLIPHKADRICWVCPRYTLRDQAERAFAKQRLREWLGDMRMIRAAENNVNPSRDTHGYTTTYQAVAANPDLHRMEFDRYRYILVLDEFHHLEYGGPWHVAVKQLVDRAVLVLMMTGTLERGDGNRIGLLEYRDIGISETPDTSETDSRAFVSYSRADALAERAIIPIEFKHFDLAADWVNGSGDRVSIQTFDQVSDDNASDAIHAGLSTQYAYDLLDHCARDWRSFQASHPTSQLLVVADRQTKARQYAKHLKDRYGIRCSVALSDDGPEAYSAIRSFRDKHTDCLVTVGMAYEGLDAPGISHIACLTHIRSKPWIDQMLGRGVRVDPDGGPWQKQRLLAYVPDDPFMREVIERIRSEQAPFIRQESEDVNGSAQGEKSSDVELSNIVPLGGQVSGLRMSELDGDSLSRDETAALQYAIGAVGKTGQITPIELKRMMAAFNEAPPRQMPQGTTYSEAETKLRSDIENATRRIDSIRKWNFGTTNGIIAGQFRKSRTEMTIEELGLVWGFLISRFPELLS